MGMGFGSVSGKGGIGAEERCNHSPGCRFDQRLSSSY